MDLSRHCVPLGTLGWRLDHLNLSPFLPLDTSVLLTLVAQYVQAERRHGDHELVLGLERWDPTLQQYHGFQVEVPRATHGEDALVPLGCSFMSFTHYYYGHPSLSVSNTACDACYHTTLASAAHAAALQGHVSCLSALLSLFGTELLDWRDEQYRTPLFYACYASQFDCITLLIEHTYEPYDVEQGADMYGDSPIHAAVATDTIELVRHLLDLLITHHLLEDLNQIVNPQTQMTCVHMASSVTMLHLLVDEYHADVLILDRDGRMPLFHACLRNDVASVAYLSAMDPDFVDYADAMGNTPLHIAAWAGLEQVVQELLQHVPTIALYVPNSEGKNVLALAHESGCDAVLQLLKQHQHTDEHEDG